MTDGRNVIIFILVGIIALLLIRPRIIGNSPVSGDPLAPRPLPPSQGCQVSNCHGLDIQCSTEGPTMCTMMYGFGDRCREHAQCGIVNGACAPILTDAFQECVSCVRACEAAHPDDMPQAFACESRC